MTVREELDKLKTTDIYSLLLFVLYKLNEVPEYSALSELAYILDKNNLLKLCEYFGGVTIKIPTVDDLEELVDCLLLYQYVNIDRIPYEEAVKQIGFPSSKLRRVKTNYNKICNILSEYTFVSR